MIYSNILGTPCIIKEYIVNILTIVIIAVTGQCSINGRNSQY